MRSRGFVRRMWPHDISCLLKVLWGCPMADEKRLAYKKRDEDEIEGKCES